MKTILLLLASLAILAVSRAADDYESHIRKLAAGTPPDEIKATLRALDDAGPAAFPALLAHFADTHRAEPRFFQREVVERQPGGASRLHAPTIGEACFDILQNQIEGNWPKAYRTYSVLSPANARQWLEAHPGLTVAQLRRAARTESLRLAEAALAKDPTAESLQRDVAFLREELKTLQP